MERERECVGLRNVTMMYLFTMSGFKDHAEEMFLYYFKIAQLPLI